MSSLMYPKVFSDYMGRLRKKGPLLRFLPTVAYFYGLLPGQELRMKVPSRLVRHLLLKVAFPLAVEGPKLRQMNYYYCYYYYNCFLLNITN